MTSGVWRSGNRMVMAHDATLPDRCVKSNEPADGSWVDIQLSWHHPALYLVLLGNLIIYLIVAHFMSKRVVVRLGLSDSAAASNRRAWHWMWGLLAAGFAVTAIGALNESLSFAIAAGLLMMLAAVPVYLWGARLVWATRMDDGLVWIAGVNPDYLDSLPGWKPRD